MKKQSAPLPAGAKLTRLPESPRDPNLSLNPPRGSTAWHELEMGGWAGSSTHYPISQNLKRRGRFEPIPVDVFMSLESLEFVDEFAEE